jgi:hypothetical protein
VEERGWEEELDRRREMASTGYGSVEGSHFVMGGPEGSRKPESKDQNREDEKRLFISGVLVGITCAEEGIGSHAAWLCRDQAR